MKKSYKKLSAEDLLFENYLMAIRISSTRKLLEESPPVQMIVLKAYESVLTEYEQDQQNLLREIETRGLSGLDPWTGEKLRVEDCENCCEDER